MNYIIKNNITFKITYYVENTIISAKVITYLCNLIMKNSNRIGIPLYESEIYIKIYDYSIIFILKHNNLESQICYYSDDRDNFFTLNDMAYLYNSKNKGIVIYQEKINIDEHN